MANDLNSLSEEHVHQLSRIIESLENSTFDFLQLEVGELKVTLGKGSALPAEVGAPSQLPAPAPAPPKAAAEASPAPAPSITPKPSAAPPAAQAGAEISAPIIGMFYAQPEPGAPPFVTVGDMVQPDTTVGLIEVMKTYNAVSAGVAGKVVEVCVVDAELVEYGQLLFRVAPE